MIKERMKMFKMVPTNDVTVEITPSRPWIVEFTADQAYRQSHDIADQIRRHVDGFENVCVNQKYAYIDHNGMEHETLYDALEYWFDEDGALEKYEVRYERPNDNAVGIRRAFSSFKEVVEEAWNNPNEFEILSGPKLTAPQYTFLTKVLDVALNHQMGVKED